MKERKTGTIKLYGVIEFETENESRESLSEGEVRSIDIMLP